MGAKQHTLQSISGHYLRHLSRSVDAIWTLLLAHPRLFCGVASSRPLSLELIRLLRVAPIVDAVKRGCMQSFVQCTRLGDSRSPVGFAEPTCSGLWLSNSLPALYACYTLDPHSTIHLNSV